MSEEILHSYSLNSAEEPSDEMLAAIMEKVAQSARTSTARAQETLQRMFDETVERIRAQKRQSI